MAAALGNSRGFFSSIGVIDADKVAVLESALDALGDDDGRERALLLATLCSELALGTTLDRRQELADAARAMARRLGDPDTVIRTLNLVCDPLQVPSTLSERMVDAKEALELSELLGDPDLLFWTGAYSRLAAVQAGDFEMARRCLATMRSVISGLRQPTMMWVTLFNDAADALLTGDPDRAEQLATAALEIGIESGQPDAFGFYGAEMIGVRRQQGRYGELVPLIEEIAAENPALPVFRATLAEGHMEAGEVDTARQMLEAASADLTSLPYDVVWIFAVASYADVATELRAEAPARLLLDLLAPSTTRFSSSGRQPEAPWRITAAAWSRYSAATMTPKRTSPKQPSSTPGVRWSSLPPSPTCDGVACSWPAAAQAISNGPEIS